MSKNWTHGRLMEVAELALEAAQNEKYTPAKYTPAEATCTALISIAAALIALTKHVGQMRAWQETEGH